jgi:hypothetical protein
VYVGRRNPSPLSIGPTSISSYLYFFNIHPIQLNKSRDSWVGIALVYGLDDRGSRALFPAGAGNLSLHHRVQNGSGAHPASYLMGTRGSFPGSKPAGAWSWPLLVQRLRMRGDIPPLSDCVLMTRCVVKHRVIFTCTLSLQYASRNVLFDKHSVVDITLNLVSILFAVT